MNEKEFQSFKLTEMASVFSLGNTWSIMQEKLNEKVAKIKEIDNLDIDSMNTLESGLDDFGVVISKITSHEEEPSRETTSNRRTPEELFEDYLEKYSKWQMKKIDEILAKLPDIFSNVLDAFMLDVEFSGRSKSSLSKKFQIYNLTLRFPKDGDYELLDLKKCDLDYGNELLNDRNNSGRQHLMQGFDGVEFMITHLRNFSQHRYNNDGKKILKNDLKRKIEDPITSAGSVGNIITLCSALTLCAYQFDEILQTWIDTDTYIEKKAGN